MVFEQGQAQGVVLQYHGRDHARRDRDIMAGATPEKVTGTYDYGRELTFRPMNVQTTLIQDIEKATDANYVVTLKNEECQLLARTLAQAAVGNNAEVQTAMRKQQLASGMQGMQRPGILS